MNDTFQCGDHGALVAYLYDECEPSEQASIAAHLARCMSCAGEVEALSATRRTLAAWAPPETPLNFRITRSDASSTGKVLERGQPWWRAPLPAWAQAAAALLIFAAGLSIGVARAGLSAGEDPKPSSSVSGATGTTTTAASREDLARVEARLRAEMTSLRSSSPTTASARVSEEGLMKEVRALIEESEANQRRDFTLRMVDLASGFEQQRRVDLASVRQSMGQLQGMTGTELRQQRELNNYLINVSERAR